LNDQATICRLERELVEAQTIVALQRDLIAALKSGYQEDESLARELERAKATIALQRDIITTIKSDYDKADPLAQLIQRVIVLVRTNPDEQLWKMIEQAVQADMGYKP
jgi:hypothetical protein